MISNKLHIYNKRFLARRLYSTAAQQYEAFDDNIFYTPVRKVNFQSGKSTIFYQDTAPK
jgi:hypothetical protein